MVDACFLINWSRFRQRNDLFTLYSRLVIPSVVFVEVKREPARSFISQLLATKTLLLAPRIASVDSLALRLFEAINSDPNLPSIDPPEAYALAFAKVAGLPFLTDNVAPKAATLFIRELSGVRVYDSLDVLNMLYSGSRLREKVGEFMREVGVRFSRRRLRELGLA